MQDHNVELPILYELANYPLAKTIIWAVEQGVELPSSVATFLERVWWLQVGMAIALKHPEYAHVWLEEDKEKGKGTYDFLVAADSFVQQIPLEVQLGKKEWDG